MDIPTDFVFVRFASAPYFGMRTAHMTISPWLTSRNIECTRVKSRIYFSLPDELSQFTEVTSAVIDLIRPYATNIKNKLSALQYTKASKYRDPLSEKELRLLYDAGITLIL